MTEPPGWRAVLDDFLAKGRSLPPDADPRTFFVALHEALWGFPPFAGGRLREAPPGATVPAQLREIVLRGLSDDPDDRYPSIAAAVADLAAIPALRRRAARRLGLLAVAVVAALLFFVCRPGDATIDPCAHPAPPDAGAALLAACRIEPSP